MATVTEFAFAKINLFLDLTSKLENGYHTIDGIMQNVDLFDTVCVSKTDASETAVSLEAVGNPNLPCDRRNLAWKAAIAFLDAVKCTASLHISMEKRIPMSAGMAGGSADAAAVLRALNRLFGQPLTVEELCSIGAKLGADVPFCVRGGAMRTRGIGEILTPCAGLPKSAFLVAACAGEGVSTPWAYGELDARYGGFRKNPCDTASLEKLLEALEKRDENSAIPLLFNRFEEVVEPVRPYVTEIKKTLCECSAKVAMMSGSGPSVFGIFEKEEQAKKAVNTLEKQGIFAHLCHPIGE